jgi:hypothetical protein
VFLGEGPYGSVTVYRLYSAEGTLLYVGNSSVVEYRLFLQHLVDQSWWREVEGAKFMHFDTKAQAEAEETRAIKRERPLYNVAFNELPAETVIGSWDELLSCLVDRSLIFDRDTMSGQWDNLRK